MSLSCVDTTYGNAEILVADSDDRNPYNYMVMIMNGNLHGVRSTASQRSLPDKSVCNDDNFNDNDVCSTATPRSWSRGTTLGAARRGSTRRGPSSLPPSLPPSFSLPLSLPLSSSPTLFIPLSLSHSLSLSPSLPPSSSSSICPRDPLPPSAQECTHLRERLNTRARITLCPQSKRERV
jgi:hypothetical protein